MGDGTTWTCYLCGEEFRTGQRANSHRRNLWKSSNDPTRCDNLPTLRRPRQAPLVTRPVLLWELARREPVLWETERETRAAYTVRRTQILGTNNMHRDMTRVQDDWDSYLTVTKNLFSDEFWKIFLPIHGSPRVHIDSTLRAVKRTFVRGADRKKFATDLRTLRSAMSGLTPFWPTVLHTHRIDLSRFARHLPSGTTHVMFKFVDPIWGWLMAARRQNPQELHWKPAAQHGHRKVYGGGIQFGEFFRHACSTLPAGSCPMCIGLHWDGTSARGVSSAPICVCCGNSNSCDTSTQFCIGYMPHIPDSKRPEWRKRECATELKFYIRQQCAEAILRVIEESAKRGVLCRLQNQHNEEIDRLLFPRLSSMNMDQPEAQLYFGLQNKQSCSKCRYDHVIMSSHDITIVVSVF